MASSHTSGTSSDSLDSTHVVLTSSLSLESTHVVGLSTDFEQLDEVLVDLETETLVDFEIRSQEHRVREECV